jgi:hypothetical protein
VPIYPVAVALDDVKAVTVKFSAAPEVAVAGAETLKCVAIPEAATVMLPEVPVIDGVTVSVAVIVCVPLVFSVTEKVATPLVRVEFVGSTACPSLLVKCTVPEYPVAVAFEASSAVTVKLIAVPAIAVAGAVTEKCVAVCAADETVTVPDDPVIEPVTVSVAVIVCGPVVFSVTEKVPTPLVKVEFAGRTASPSLLVKWTVPE